MPSETSESEEMRLYIVARSDLSWTLPDALACAARASWSALAEARRGWPDRFAAYDRDVQAKIALRVKTLDHLDRAIREASEAGLPVAIASDDRQPVIAAIGPARRSEMPKFIAKLQIFQDIQPEARCLEMPSFEESAPALWILTRRNLALPIGKSFAQGGHVAFATLIEADGTAVAAWEQWGKAVRVLDCADCKTMAEGHIAAQRLGLPNAYIVDAGRTVFLEPTPTLAGIGPCRRPELPAIVRQFSPSPLVTTAAKLAP